MSNTMREILFRGKRVDNGEWIEGYLVKKVAPIYVDIKYYFILHQEKDNLGCLMSFTSWDKIDPKTVGQFTSLTDKNGNKIFEGDIVKIKGKIRYIFYGISSFRHTNYGEYAEELKDVNTDRDCEIISNIHDNPELLEKNNENT